MKMRNNDPLDLIVQEDEVITILIVKSIDLAGRPRFRKGVFRWLEYFFNGRRAVFELFKAS